MNIILFTRRRNGTSSQYDLSQPRLFAGLLTGTMAVAAAVFLSGFLYAVNKHEVDPNQQVLELEAALAAQERELIATREEARENIEALAVRIGQMQAHVIRVDALGHRLTKMADLEDGEFNFTAPPPRGGPELELARSEVNAQDFLNGLDDLELLIQDRDKQLGVLESLLLTKNLEEEIHPAGRPISSGWISSFYGTRRDPFTGRRARHEGVDFAGRAGTEIVAVGAGVVSWSADRYGYGNMVEINHGNGYRTRYAHNQANLVSVGDKIEKGQTVALMGSTGRATGPNLHFEVLYNGRTVDPVKYINSQTQ
ncbi:MAG: M23 family metallopeptidase [Gammaproteobacteria bacterium]|nr:M23 family metallopeptidase [Gammaproteobacteria bacterium]